MKNYVCTDQFEPHRVVSDSTHPLLRQANAQKKKLITQQKKSARLSKHLEEVPDTPIQGEKRNKKRTCNEGEVNNAPNGSTNNNSNNSSNSSSLSNKKPKLAPNTSDPYFSYSLQKLQMYCRKHNLPTAGSKVNQYFLFFESGNF